MITQLVSVINISSPKLNVFNGPLHFKDHVTLAVCLSIRGGVVVSESRIKVPACTHSKKMTVSITSWCMGFGF